MRPEAVRQALRESEGRPAVIHLNDGSRLRVRSREHRFISPEYLYILVGRTVHHVAFRNFATISVRQVRPSGRRERAG